MTHIETLEAGAEYLKNTVPGFTPDVALVLGSGLGGLTARVEKTAEIPYGEIPGFKVSTAPYHKGSLVLGTLGGRNVAVMQGRLHYYEGYSMSEVADPIRVLRLFGAKKLVVTNAAGGVNEGFSRGDLMLITDHIKLFTDGPARGANLPFGPRFFDMTEVYSSRLGGIFEGIASKRGVKLQKGTYMFFPGPQYETPAEIRMARTLGADAVGMSTVPEAIAARQAGMEILGVSLISNLAAGMSGKELSEEEVAEAGITASDMLCGLMEEFLKAVEA